MGKIYIAGWIDDFVEDQYYADNTYYCSEKKESYVLSGSVAAWNFAAQKRFEFNFQREFKEYSCTWGPRPIVSMANVNNLPFGPPFKHLELPVVIGEAIRGVQLNVVLTHVDSREVIANSTMDLVAVAPIDVGVDISTLETKLSASTISVDRLDFLEIGTSNFDTCLQMADELGANLGFSRFCELYDCSIFSDDRALQLASGHIYHGISVDAVNYYLRDLPNVAGVEKLNFAVDVGPLYGAPSTVYHFPYSLLGKVLNYTGGGMSTVNRIAPVPFTDTEMIAKDLMTDGGFVRNLRFMQRSFVPTLTVEQLLSVFVARRSHQAAINLLKIDVEGMDHLILNSVLDFYGNRYGNLTSLWPCVIAYETVHIPTPARISLAERIHALGYDIRQVSTLDSISLNHLCVLDDIATSFLLLNTTIKSWINAPHWRGVN